MFFATDTHNVELPELETFLRLRCLRIVLLHGIAMKTQDTISYVLPFRAFDPQGVVHSFGQVVPKAVWVEQ